MRLLDGKKLAKKILKNLKKKVSQMKKKPVLAMILVGNDLASSIYVRRKEIFCAEAGIESKTLKLSEKISEKKLLGVIKKLNKDKKISAIMVQLPLPKHIDKNKIIEAIDPRKDADCLHPENYGKFAQVGENYSLVAPATPFGIMKLLEEYRIKIEGRHAVVVGRSNIVGKPMAQFLLNYGATVTICHRQTKKLSAFTRQADILVVAVGRRNLIRADMVKRGVVVIDVGINRRGLTSTISGDVAFASVYKKASYITPVPGGVGPVTIAMLLWNTVQLAKNQELRNTKGLRNTNRAKYEK
jgi:methylenetetrahydrofolate dehydrogenase (NADP+)/methenyltetrahydrofolate cyclohydrolase